MTPVVAASVRPPVGRMTSTFAEGNSRRSAQRLQQSVQRVVLGRRVRLTGAKAAQDAVDLSVEEVPGGAVERLQGRLVGVPEGLEVLDRRGGAALVTALQSGQCVLGDG